MKTAIFHDYFDQIGGGELFVLELAKRLDATIIATRIDKKEIQKTDFKNINFIELPLFLRNPVFRNLSSIVAFSRADFSKDFDFFIFSGYWSLFASKKHNPNFYYCHDLLTEFYDLEEFNLKGKSFIEKLFHKLRAIFFKPVFEKQLNNTGKIIANSEFTRKRIEKYYSKKSRVVYPMINFGEFKNRKSNGYWLSVNRISPRKRIDLQLKAFELMPEKKLFIAGNFIENDANAVNYYNQLLSNKPSNVEFLLGLSREKLVSLYSQCEGLLATSKNESFGMTVIEAMSSGKPVVCVDEGGFRETVLNGKTGFLVNPNAFDLSEAVKKVSKNPEKYKVASLKQAEKFGVDNFSKAISEYLP